MSRFIKLFLSNLMIEMPKYWKIKDGDGSHELHLDPSCRHLADAGRPFDVYDPKPEDNFPICVDCKPWTVTLGKQSDGTHTDPAGHGKKPQ